MFKDRIKSYKFYRNIYDSNLYIYIPAIFVSTLVNIVSKIMDGGYIPEFFSFIFITMVFIASILPYISYKNYNIGMGRFIRSIPNAFENLKCNIFLNRIVLTIYYLVFYLINLVVLKLITGNNYFSLYIIFYTIVIFYLNSTLYIFLDSFDIQILKTLFAIKFILLIFTISVGYLSIYVEESPIFIKMAFENIVKAPLTIIMTIICGSIFSFIFSKIAFRNIKRGC